MSFRFGHSMEEIMQQKEMVEEVLERESGN